MRMRQGDATLAHPHGAMLAHSLPLSPCGCARETPPWRIRMVRCLHTLCHCLHADAPGRRHPGASAWCDACTLSATVSMRMRQGDATLAHPHGAMLAHSLPL